MKPEQKMRVLHTLHWNYESKNIALHNALKILSPMQYWELKELKIGYSQYFVNLISATELLLDKSFNIFHEEFRNLLSEHFVFDGFCDGRENYSYIRELRNSLVHRGLDIAAITHFIGNFPMVISPDSIENRNETKYYQPFGYYLLEIIQKCESIIGPAIANHLMKEKYFITDNKKTDIEEIIKYLNSSKHIPEHIKAIVYNSTPEDKRNIEDAINSRNPHQFNEALLSILLTNQIDEEFQRVKLSNEYKSIIFKTINKY